MAIHPLRARNRGILRICVLTSTILGAVAGATAPGSPNAGITWEQGPDGGPGQRFALCAAWDTLDNGCLVYGGERLASPGRFSIENDLWLFSPSSRSWSAVPAADPPPARGYHAGAWDSKRKLLWVFGGVGSDLASRDDLWRFDAKTRHWSQVVASGDAPKARLSPCLHYSARQDCLILYGGSLGFQQIKAFTDVWTFAIATNTWSRVSSDGPGRWQFASAWDDRASRLVVQGGYDTDAKPTATTWTWDAATGAWSHGDEHPEPLLAQSAVWDDSGERMLMFGGAREGQPGSKVLYSWSKGDWHTVAQQDAPAARAYGCMARDPHDGTLVIFGGVSGTFGSPMVPGNAWIGKPSPR